MNKEELEKKYTAFHHIDPNPKKSYFYNHKPEEVPLKGKYYHEIIMIESLFYFWNSITQKWMPC